MHLALRSGALAGRFDDELLAEGASRLDVVGQEILGGRALRARSNRFNRFRICLSGDTAPRCDRCHRARLRTNGIKYGGNAAAGLAFGGNLVAVGLVLFGGTRLILRAGAIA